MYGSEARIADAFGSTISFYLPVRLSFEMELSRELAISFGAKFFGASLSEGVKVIFRAVDYVNLRGHFHIKDVVGKGNIALSEADCHKDFDDIDMEPASYPYPQGNNGSSGQGSSGSRPKTSPGSGGDHGDYSGSQGGPKGSGTGESDSGGNGGYAGNNGNDNNSNSGGGDTQDKQNDIEIIIIIEDSTPVVA